VAKLSSDATNIFQILILKLFIVRCIKNSSIFCDDNGAMYHNTLHLKNSKDWILYIWLNIKFVCH